jgi:hypothetical protein
MSGLFTNPLSAIYIELQSEQQVKIMNMGVPVYQYHFVLKGRPIHIEHACAACLLQP